MKSTSARQSLSKFASGPLSAGGFDLYALLDSFAVQAGTTAKLSGKFIEVTTSEQTPRYLVGNHLRFTDVLNNVASYALTHLDDGGILFNVHAYPIKQSKYRIDITVVTTGTGISSHKLNTVFLPDYNTGEQNSNSLFLAKTISSLMGGDLTIENTFGWGTRYLLHLIMGSEVSDNPAHH